MKTMLKTPGTALALACALLSAPSSHAATLYWDTNGSTAGAGATADGTWDTTTANWNTNSDGTGATTAYTAGQNVVFSAASDTTSATVNVSGSIFTSAFEMTVNAGTYQFTGSQINNLSTITVSSGANVTTASIRFNGTGNPAIQVNGTLTSGSVISNGTLTLNGTGSIVSNGTVDGHLAINGGSISVNGGNKTKNVAVSNTGKLILAGNDSIENTRNVTLTHAGSTLQLNAGVTDTINNLTGSGLVTGASGSVLTVGADSKSGNSFSGTISGDISIGKTGTTTFTFSGASTSTGDITVSDGAYTLAETGTLTFYIGADGVSNKVTGTGTATFDGTFAFDLSGAAPTDGNSWLIVNVGTLTESFSGGFTVSSFTETALNSGIWNLGGFTFTEDTGILSYSAIPEPSAFALFGGLASIAVIGFRRRRA